MLDINMRFKHGVLIVRLKGVLNNINNLNELKDLIKTNGIKYVLLNLNHIKKINNSGLVALEQIHNEIIKNKGKFIICGDKTLNYNNTLTNNLYQVCEEDIAYEMIDL